MKPKECAVKIAELCNRYGWEYEVRGSVLTIRKRIPVNDNEAFVTADMEYGSILGYLPSTRPGSVWGTDGGGIGALAAIKSGVFTMNKSGGSKLVLKALAKAA
jgi:hypothetical protein